MSSFTVREEQNRYKHYARHLHPVGIAHNMRPKSVETLLEKMGREEIRNATVLDIGCGQGYLVSHFLNAGASHVVGTDITQQIRDTIPMAAYQDYMSQGKRVEFRLEDFKDMNSDHYKNYKIISMFIGINALVKKLILLFRDHYTVKIIGFMIPTRGFKTLYAQINQLCEIFQWEKHEFPIHLANSGEQRRAMVLRKPANSYMDLTKEIPDMSSSSDTSRGGFYKPITQTKRRKQTNTKKKYVHTR